LVNLVGVYMLLVHRPRTVSAVFHIVAQ